MCSRQRSFGASRALSQDARASGVGDSRTATDRPLPFLASMWRSLVIPPAGGAHRNQCISVDSPESGFAPA